jgi:hypothetical protein
MADAFFARRVGDPMPRIQLEVEFQGRPIPALTVGAINLGEGRFQYTGAYVLNGQPGAEGAGLRGLLTNVIEPKIREQYVVHPDIGFRATDPDVNRVVIVAFHKNDPDQIVNLARRNGGRRKTRRRKTYRQRRR